MGVRGGYLVSFIWYLFYFLFLGGKVFTCLFFMSVLVHVSVFVCFFVRKRMFQRHRFWHFKEHPSMAASETINLLELLKYENHCKTFSSSKQVTFVNSY